MAVKGHVNGMSGCYVIGWALPATADRGNCEISITDDAGNVLATGRASRHREDLAVLGVGRTTFAFRIAVNTGPDRRVLHVCADGEPLPGSPLAVGAGHYDGDCNLTRGALSGWISERFADFEAPEITVVNQHGRVVGRCQSAKAPAEFDPLCTPARFAFDLDNQCFGAGEMRLNILANGVKFAERSCHLTLLGNLETITDELYSGWLLSPEVPERVFEFDVFQDGQLAGSVKCDIPREDVRAVHPNVETPGFDARLYKPDHSILDSTHISFRFRGSSVDLFDGPYVVASRPAAIVAVQRAARLMHHATATDAAERGVLQVGLSEFLTSARRGRGFIARHQAALPPPDKQGIPRLSIIIPVYLGVAVTRACIESVLAHRSEATDHVILINDASPDEAMAGMLRGFANVRNVFVLTNNANLGFIKTVNRGLGFATGSDVVLLNSDTVLFAGGLDEMCRIAYSADEIGTVTALSSNATIFSYPHIELRAEELPDIGWAQLAQIALRDNAGLSIDIPTGHGFCLLIKASVLSRIGCLDESFGRGYGEENDLCVRAADIGYRHVLAAGAFVQHRESISFVEEKDSLLAQNLPRLNEMYPEYTPVVMSFENEDGIRQARWALDRARLRMARERGQEFVLLVTNALEGGTAKAIKDIENTVGYSGAAKLTLHSQPNGFLALLCDEPALHASFSPRECEDLFRLLLEAQPARLLVHQLLGFPAAFIQRLASWAKELHSVYYIHDFYPICPRVTMIDAIGRFCDVADTDTCARCVAMGGSHETSRLNELTPAEHRALFADMLAGCRNLVAPSANAAGYIQRAFPGLQVRAVPHPERADNVAVAARAGSDDEVVLLGAIGAHKGSGKLFEIAERARLTHPKLRFRVIGHTDIDRALGKLGNVIITGKYQPEQLPGLIAQARGRLALFLSLWPETYSYTLSEVARYGFIPLVPDIGAPAERVRAAGYGVVVPFPVDAAQVLQVIDDVSTGRKPPYAEGATPSRLFPTREDVEIGISVLKRQDAAPESKPDAPAVELAGQ